MNATRLSLFTATLVQDSALSISGIDRETSADQSFALVNKVPTISGRGLKGAAVAMARRFFDPLPRSVSENAQRSSAYRRSAWEFANATPEGGAGTIPRLRAGVGIRHKTGARAGGVLYDREVIPANTRWPLKFRVDWSLASEGAAEAEGILAYVLDRQWSAGRCWLGGDVARGLGWCHIEDLRAFRLDTLQYDRWVESGRTVLPDALSEVPIIEPTRSWCFRTLDVELSFGEYRPVTEEAAWGLDMLAIGPHDAERTIQTTGDGIWAKPSWAPEDVPTPDIFGTDHALVMEGNRPLLPGSSVRGPLRHAFSRAKRAGGQAVQDPHQFQGKVAPDDVGGKIFGTVTQSSRILIRDGRAEQGWAAARLHMHAEDEFSAGSYGSAKRDAVRLLRGIFPIRIVIEGNDAEIVEPLIKEMDRLIALGEIGHLPVGGHKTKGAGWGRWRAGSWSTEGSWAATSENADLSRVLPMEPSSHSQTNVARPEPSEIAAESKRQVEHDEMTQIRVTNGSLSSPSLTLGEAAAAARTALGERYLVAWWCDPVIDLALADPPAVFGRQWPDSENIRIDEVAFYTDRAVWRAARTVAGLRWVTIEDIGSNESGTHSARIVHTPARLHGNAGRFSAAHINQDNVLLREWHVDGQLLGFTLVGEKG